MQFLTTVNVGSGRVSHAWKHGVADVISILSESDLRGDGFCPRVAVVDGGNLIFGCQCYQLNARIHIVAAASIGVCAFMRRSYHANAQKNTSVAAA